VVLKTFCFKNLSRVGSRFNKSIHLKTSTFYGTYSFHNMPRIYTFYLANSMIVDDMTASVFVMDHRKTKFYLITN